MSVVVDFFGRGKFLVLELVFKLYEIWVIIGVIFLVDEVL